MATVTLDNVTKRFGRTTALSDLSFRCEEGEFFTLFGPSGAGKTTTLELIAGIKSRYEGRILIGDREVGSLPLQERNVAMAFENYALYPHMTVADNVGYPLKKRGVPKAERDARIAVYCASGGRSHGAVQMLRKLGYDDVHNIGGLSHWAQAGGAIER